MKKIISIIAIIALIISGAFAYGGFRQGMSENFNTETYDKKVEYQNRMMYEIVENGSYDDLIELREDSGLPFVRWVDSEEDFELWQEMHEERKELGIAGQGYGMGRHNRGNGNGNCMFR